MGDSYAAKEEAAARDKFKDLCSKPLEEQRDFFIKRFVTDLSDEEYDEVMDIANEVKDKSKGTGELDYVGAADVLQHRGKARTAIQRKKEMEDVDINQNQKICLIEYLLLHFKIKILQSFFKRNGMDPDVDMDNDGVGLAGVGSRLISELYAPPLGIDPELEKMMRELSVTHDEREKKIKELEETIAQGGVKAMATKAEKEKLTAANESEINHVNAKIEAAKKKAQKAAEKAIEEKEAKRKEADAAGKGASKAKLSEKAAAFSG